LLKQNLVAGFLFFFFLASGFALEASLNQEVFSPGDKMVFTLQAEPGAAIGGGTVHGETILPGGLVVVDETGFKLFERTVSVLDVPGEYVRVFKDISTGELVKVNYSVQPLKPASLSLELIEPLQPVLKNQAFTLSVELSKEGLPVENALVFCWRPNGQKIQLEEFGEGLYSSPYTVYSADFLDFPLQVFAVESIQPESDWASEEFGLKLKKIDIGLERVQPLEPVYVYNQPFEAFFRVDYPREFGRPVVKMVQGRQRVDLRQGEDNYFHVSFSELQTLTRENSPITFSILAYDSFGNRVEKEFSFAQQGYAFWFWKTAIFYVIFPFFFLAYLTLLGIEQYKGLKKSSHKKRKQGRKR
jgi:hypothetical protein